MPHNADEVPMAEAQRREIFAALVAAQDSGLSVPASRQTVADSFGIELDLVRAIEEEGLDNQWPPL